MTLVSLTVLTAALAFADDSLRSLPEPAVETLKRLDSMAREIEKTLEKREGREVHVAALLNRQYAEQLGCDRNQAYTVCSYRFDQHNRDDRERAHNDWNVWFGSTNRLDFVIGAAAASRSWSLPTSEFPRAWSMEPTRSNPKRLWPARVGEVLLLHTLDPDDDGWFGLQVIGMEEGEWIMLRYEQVDPLESDALWVDQLPEQLLLDGDVQLRIRPGQDPNPHRIYLTGVGTQRVDRVVNFPFDPDLVQPERDSWAWAKGGWIPRGQAYVIDKILIRGEGVRQSSVNPPYVKVVADGYQVHDLGYSDPFEFSWKGRMVLYPGMEHLLYLEVYGMNEGEVFIEGKLVDEKSVGSRKLDRLDARERRQLDKWILDLERSSGDQDVLSKMNLIGPRLRPALEAIPVDTLRGGARNAVLEALDRLQQ